MKRSTSRREKLYDEHLTNSKWTRLTDQLIRAAIEPYGIALTDRQVDAIRRYTSVLLLWNEKVNLTSLRDPEEILARHFGESLFALPAVPISAGRLADVGSGAGFPGMALKILLPELELVLIESNFKKAGFLMEIARLLELEAKIRRVGFEEVEQPDYFDFVTARALGNLPQLLKWTRRVLRKGGSVVLWLGAQDAERLSSTSGWRWRRPILLPKSRQRVLLIGQPSAS